MLYSLLIAAGIYLFFLLMGWGATRLILPKSTRSYQFWIAPWFGLIVADISVVWFSRLGLGTNWSIYLVTLLGISLLALCKFRKVSLSIPWQKFDAIIALGTLIALFLALSPLLATNPEPTTISLRNLDPIIYANAGDFLKSHSINQEAEIDLEYPSTILISHALEPGHRPGSWLILGLIASLFNLKTYEIFTLTISIFFALTPSLITILTWVLAKHYLAAIISLTISVLNVNSLYFNYHGFAAQIFAQGCMVLVFLWLYLEESNDEPYESYLLPLGITLSSLFTLYPEIGLFCIIQICFYVAFNLINKNVQKHKFFKKITLVFALIGLIDPIAVWQGIQFVVIWSQGIAGWSMPRWAFPADIVGLFSIHSGENYSNIFLIITNSLVVALIALGIYCLDNKSLSLSSMAFIMIVLGWLGIARGFSYGYYKTTGFFTFIFITYFSLGLSFAVFKVNSLLNHKFNKNNLKFISFVIQSASICTVLFLNYASILPTFKTMEAQQLRVTRDLASLSNVALISQQKINLELSTEWEQSWAMSLLSKNRIKFIDIVPDFFRIFIESTKINDKLKYKFFPIPPSKNYSSAWDDGELVLVSREPLIIDVQDNLIWKNYSYELATNQNFSKISVRLGENWWGSERWEANQFDIKSKAFQWANQDAILYIENKKNQPIPISLGLQLLPILSKTTLDVYVNNKISESLKINPDLDLYVFNCQLNPGKNKIMLHTKEGTVTPPGDTRNIALGVNGIYLNLTPYSTKNPDLESNITNNTIVNKRFSQEIQLLEPLKSAKAGTKIEIPILVRNSSNFVWEPKNSNPVNFAYRWSDLNGKIVVLDGERTILPTKLPPKRSMRLNAVVKLPSSPGNYILTLTMVQEYVGWFNQKGAQAPQIPVRVSP
jgi:hypothetical protein